jgi:hypothetical protein
MSGNQIYLTASLMPNSMTMEVQMIFRLDRDVAPASDTARRAPTYEWQIALLR